MRLSIKIVEKQQQIEKGVLQQFLPQISKKFNSSVSLIKIKLPPLIQDIVINTPEYESLVGGALKYELGIPDAVNKVSEMIDIWTNNIRYNYTNPRISKNQIKGSFSANLFKSDFSDILGTEASKVYDIARGYELPWLQWLVIDGNLPIVTSYEVEYRTTNRSRTGGALMVPGSSWSVPEFTGTIADNWITRSINANSGKIQNLMQRAFK